MATKQTHHHPSESITLPEGYTLDRFGFLVRPQDAAGMPTTRGTLEAMRAVRSLRKVKACKISAMRLKRLLRDAGEMGHVPLGEFLCGLALCGFDVRPKPFSRDALVNVSTRSIHDLELKRDQRFGRC
ncbi:hypothetical protein SH467x_000595 [Pirellulaceae bacterium SH467]